MEANDSTHNGSSLGIWTKVSPWITNLKPSPLLVFSIKVLYSVLLFAISLRTFNCQVPEQFQSSFRVLRNMNYSFAFRKTWDLAPNTCAQGELGPQLPRGRSGCLGGLSLLHWKELELSREEEEIAIFISLFLSFSLGRLTRDWADTFHSQLFKGCYFRIINLAEIFAFLSLLCWMFS